MNFFKILLPLSLGTFILRRMSLLTVFPTLHLLLTLLLYQKILKKASLNIKKFFVNCQKIRGRSDDLSYKSRMCFDFSCDDKKYKREAKKEKYKEISLWFKMFF